MKKALAYGLIVLAFLLVGGSFSFAIFQPIQVLPRIRLSPGFALTDQNGQRITNEDLRGKIVLYSFDYTNCSDPCRSTTPVMQTVQKVLSSLETGGVNIQLVTISVGPDRDSPEALAVFASEAGADPTRWRFATTSDPTMLKNIVGAGFKVYYQAQPDETIQLDQAFVLVDSLGIIRGEYFYPSVYPDEERLLRHIQVLVDEIHNSTGAAKLAYEAAHLFLCYAP